MSGVVTIDGIDGVPAAPLASGGSAVVTFRAHEDIMAGQIVEIPATITMPDGSPASGVLHWPITTHQVINSGFTISLGTLPAGLTVTPGPGPNQITFHQA